MIASMLSRKFVAWTAAGLLAVAVPAVAATTHHKHLGKATALSASHALKAKALSTKHHRHTSLTFKTAGAQPRGSHAVWLTNHGTTHMKAIHLKAAKLSHTHHHHTMA